MRGLGRKTTSQTFRRRLNRGRLFLFRAAAPQPEAFQRVGRAAFQQAVRDSVALDEVAPEGRDLSSEAAPTAVL